jgi:hypothetical protein
MLSIPRRDYVDRLLADRLLSRGKSRLVDERPEHAGDLQLAAKCLRALSRSFNHADLITINGDTVRPGPTMLRRMTVLVIDEENRQVTPDLATMITATEEAAAAVTGG